MQVFQNKYLCFNTNRFVLLGNLEVARKIIAYEGRIWFTEKLCRCSLCGFSNFQPTHTLENRCLTVVFARIKL